MGTVYQTTLTVPTYGVGPEGTLRPSALLRMQQEAGEQQLVNAGMGAPALAARGVAFVVTRLRMQIRRLPQMDETVQLTTWHREVRGVQFFRCYTLTDADGAPLADAVGAFALVDVRTHRLLRPSALGELLPEERERVCSCPDPEKETPPALVEVAAARPRWSELDQNGHVNNTCYADLLCDNLPSGMAQKRLTAMSICFERETLPDDRLSILAAEERFSLENGATGGVAWVAGRHARGEAFVGKLCFEDAYERRF